MTSPSAQYFQQQVQALDGILYKTRSYRDPQRIRNDVIDLLKNTPSLQPRAGSLGQSQNQILFLAGTVPIFYNGAQYNIPMNIWIIEAYPFSPPVCYVTPTTGMIIKPKHKHVDSNGMCYLPYLSNWNPNNCNLVGLIGTISKVFSQDPPVRSAQTTPPPPQPTPQPQPQPTQPPAYPYAQPQPQPYPAQPPQYGTQPFEDPSTVAKRNAVNSGTERIQARLHQFYQITTKEIDDMIMRNSENEGRVAALQLERQRLEMEKAQMEADIDGLTRNFEDLAKWLETNDGSNSIDIDAVTEPKDSLSKQLLYLVAEEATIEDTLYYMEKKMNAGGMDIDTYLKSVRSLSAEQFMKRATIRKLHERQRAGR